MKYSKNSDMSVLVGKKTLIYGEANTGKTLYTAKFVQYLIENKKFRSQEISILDFAPRLTYFKNLKIGGRIQDYYEHSLKCNLITFVGEIIPPRLKAKNKSDLYSNLCNNFKKIHETIEKYNNNPTPVLIINDISLFLHLGSKKYLINAINKSGTFFGNSYYGSSISSKFSKLLSIIEKKKVEFLIKNVDNYFKTS
jgi:flavodoxin